MSFVEPASPATADSDGVLRVGVIGAGVMGTNHGRVLAGLPNVVLVGIVDPLDEHRKRADDLIGCPVFADLEGLLAAGVDAVTIAAPTHLHHEIALACIARGVHVLAPSSAFARPVAEMTQGLMIDLARGITAADRAMRGGREKWLLDGAAVCALLALSILAVAGGGYSPFLYYRF